MTIAVTSQNRVRVTDHAGRCRRFWIYEVEDDHVVSKELLEIDKHQTFHELHGQPHPLDGIDVFITAGMGPGLKSRLEEKGIRSVMTIEMEPDIAVEQFLEGTLEIKSSESYVHRRGHSHKHQ